jgi:hypothetical protein
VDPEARTCTRCREAKSPAAFPPVRRGEPRLQTWCRPCFAEVNARNYRRDHERQKARLRRNVESNRAHNRSRVIAYLSQHPCVDCREADIVVLEFDHHRDKAADVSKLVNSGATWARVQAEIDKCDVRCANCHRRKTEDRRSHARAARRVVTPCDDEDAVRQVATTLPLVAASVSDERRECTKCQRQLSIAEFALRSRWRGTRFRICRSCKSAYHREWWARSRGDQMDRIRRNRARALAALYDRVRAYLRSHPCVDCGESDPVVLDFDHLRDKVADVSRMVRQQRPWNVIECEIENVRSAAPTATVAARLRASASTGGKSTEEAVAVPLCLEEPRPGEGSNL